MKQLAQQTHEEQHPVQWKVSNTSKNVLPHQKLTPVRYHPHQIATPASPSKDLHTLYIGGNAATQVGEDTAVLMLSAWWRRCRRQRRQQWIECNENS